jgi:UDP-glucuronate 4-epimerase
MDGDLKILVTGAAGLVGRRVIELLKDDGRPVLGTDLINHDDGAGEFVVSDLTNASSIASLFKSELTGIIHCGAISGPMLGREDPAGTIAINVQGTVNLLELARRHQLDRFVFCSSISAYGATPMGVTPVATSAPLAADEIYGASKMPWLSESAGFTGRAERHAVCCIG